MFVTWIAEEQGGVPVGGHRPSFRYLVLAHRPLRENPHHYHEFLLLKVAWLFGLTAWSLAVVTQSVVLWTVLTVHLTWWAFGSMLFAAMSPWLGTGAVYLFSWRRTWRNEAATPLSGGRKSDTQAP